MMSPAELQNFLHKQIPLAKALGVTVVHANDQSACLDGPLAPNRNHLGTAFGGSLGAILILSGYTWLYHAMESRGLACHVLLQKTETDYRHPVAKDLRATALAPSAEDLERFLQTFQKKGVARISLRAYIGSEPDPDCRFEGSFVAQKALEPQLG